ncbi:MAG: hypothetical protein ACK56I_04165, partial [bacterium]
MSGLHGLGGISHGFKGCIKQGGASGQRFDGLGGGGHADIQQGFGHEPQCLRLADGFDEGFIPSTPQGNGINSWCHKAFPLSSFEALQKGNQLVDTAQNSMRVFHCHWLWGDGLSRGEADNVTHERPSRLHKFPSP